MGRSWSLGAVWAAVVIVASCGSKTAGESRALLDACGQLHQALGQAQATCFGGLPAEWKARWDDVAPCATYAKDVGDGSVAYDAAAVAGCVNEILAAPCELPASCEYTRVFVGRVPDGMPCSDYEVCGPQSACSLPSCNATCRPIGAASLGQPCVGAACQDGLSCDAGKDACVANSQAGGPCGGTYSLGCAPGLYCKTVDTGGSGALSGTCTAFSSGPCSQDAECAFNQFCAGGTCRPRLALGAPCGDAQTGCGGFSDCDTASAAPTCIHAGLPGERCARLYGSPVLCIHGSVCGPDRLCVPRGQVGDPCDSLSCAASLVCSGTCMQCPPADAARP